jgi:autotransporter-associated beta strand protein
MAGYNGTVASLTLGGGSSTSVSNVIAVGGGTLTLAGNVTFSNLLNPLGSTISANLNLGSASRTFTVNDSTNAVMDLTLSGNIGQNATAGLTKAGSGTLLLSGTNTYTGPTSISQGTVIVTGSIAGSSLTTVNNATLAGTGTVGPLALVTGGSLSPGGNLGTPSTGTLATGASTWTAGTFTFEINDATGTQGGATGWDFVSINGALSLTSTTANLTTISVRSLTAGNISGNVPNFVYNQDHTWIFATASGGITGFDTNAFYVDATGFTNAYWPESTWTVSQVGNNLQINFTAIPEPRDYALAIVALLGVIVALRRRARLASAR